VINPGNNPGTVGAGQSPGTVAPPLTNYQPANNTGRDVGDATALGLATAGTIVGSILTWGTATPALIALDAAAIGTTIGKDVYQDRQDSLAQQRDLQAKENNATKQQIAAQNSTPAQPSQLSSPAPVQVQGANLGPATSGLKAKPDNPPTAPPEQTPVPQNAPDFMVNGTENMTSASDARVKTNVSSGNDPVERFLRLVSEKGLYPHKGRN